MVDTRNATLQNRPETLNIIGIGFAIYILPSTMINSLVTKSHSSKMVVGMELIGIDGGIGWLSREI